MDSCSLAWCTTSKGTSALTPTIAYTADRATAALFETLLDSGAFLN
ncbi:MAG: hypothetical protein JRI91_05005 [Deltaproteobacteria bacterium]|nr:hypothetical protein [Deltaproteobacteria bacterium]